MFKKLTHPGTLILIGFIVMIIFIMAIFLSVDTSSYQMVTDNYYEKEQYYQDELDAEERAQSLGNQLVVRMEGDTLIYSLPDEMYPQVDSIDLFFYHISESARDRQVVVPNAGQQSDAIVYDFTKGRNYELSFSFDYEGQRYTRKIKTR